MTPANDNVTAVAALLRGRLGPVASRDIAAELGARTKLERREVCRAMTRAGWVLRGKVWYPGARALREMARAVT